MDSKAYSVPLRSQVPGVHHFSTTFLGSELTNANAVYGFVQRAKPRWQETSREYQDVGAMERFGIDPTKPVPLGVTVTADPYGYPIDGWTTGYTVKLPPPADPVAAQRTPKSFNVIGVVERGNGSNVAPSVVPGDTPIESLSWRGGDTASMRVRDAALAASRAETLAARLRTELPGVDPGVIRAAVQQALG